MADGGDGARAGWLLHAGRTATSGAFPGRELASPSDGMVCIPGYGGVRLSGAGWRPICGSHHLGQVQTESA